MGNTDETTIQPEEESPQDNTQAAPGQPQATDTAKTTLQNKKAPIGKDIQADIRALIFGTDSYTPTQLQTQTLLDYINDEEDKTPPQILRQNGRSADNWWVWPKRHPGFMDWWNGILDRVFSEQLVRDLYKSLYKRGATHDTAAAKIVIQRFDSRFTERSQADQRHSFAGYEPSAAANSRERQRKALADRAQALPVVQGDTREGPDKPLLPASTPDCTRPTAPDQTIDSNAITGGDELYTDNTSTIHAQSQLAEPEPGTDEPQDNDKTLDSEPITHIEGAGGPLG